MPDYRGQSLVNKDLTGQTLTNSDFRFVNLSGAKLDGKNLGGSKFDGCRAEGTSFKGCTFGTATSLDGGDFQDSDWTNAVFTNVNFTNWGSYRGPYMRFAKVDGATGIGSNVNLNGMLFWPLAPVAAVSGPPVAGYAGWWHADSMSLSDGASVTTWADSSGNGKTLTSGAGSPVFKVNIQNGKPALLFNGTSSMMTAPLSLTQPYTHFLVAKTVGTINNNYIIDGASNNQGLFAFFTPSFVRMYSGSIFDVTAAIDNVVLVATILFNGSSSVFGLNGTETTGDAGAGSTTGLTVGCSGQISNFFSGYLFELISYASALSVPSRLSVVNYLRSKYGI